MNAGPADGTTTGRSWLNKRIVMLGLLTILLSVTFWSGSRYPELDEKALMGGDARLEDPLSFETLIQPQEGDPAWRRIGYTTVNWINTNKRGMAFGLALGAAMMSIIGLLKRRSYQSGFANTLLGIVMGAPLGVCVNCAAPVAKGMHQAGARLETTLAAMVSSPTLNVVVLTMVFSIFPIYFGVIKVGFTLLFILLVIPLLSRWVFRVEVVQSIDNGSCEIPQIVPILPGESWLKASIGAGRDYLKSLWFIVRTTVPLMLLAGFLGALIAVLVPLAWLATVGPGAVSVVLVAVVGLFLPVPMAFDVVIAAALLAAGMPVMHAMTLLFVLGIFSCYSTFIVATTISRRVAGTLFATLACMGIVSGMAAAAYHERELRILADTAGDASLFGSDDELPPTSLPAVSAPPPLGPPRLASAESLASSAADIRIQRIPDEQRSARNGRPFQQFTGDALGLDIDHDFRIQDFWPPFWNGRGIAAGDVNNDGWPDLVAATANGVMLYINQGGKRFVSQHLASDGMQELGTFVVSLVDLDNDGWLDLYFSAYRAGNHYILNQQGSFPTANRKQIPSGDAILNEAASWGDVDNDGDLDAALGNWFMGVAKPIPPIQSRNVIAYNEEGVTFRSVELPEITGETLSILLSDWSGDQNLDLIVGNDFEQPDIYYVGDGQGGFREVQRDEGLIPTSTMTTMSIDTADVDNDLQLDIYIAQIAARSTGEAAHADLRSVDDYCDELQPGTMRDRCQHIVELRNHFDFASSHQPSNIEKCRKVEDASERRECMGHMLLLTATRERDEDLCDHIPKKLRSWMLCHAFFEPPVVTSDQRYRAAIPQTLNENVLLMRDAEGNFVDRASERNLAVTAWSWSAKLADLDNDEWQDLYVVNGTWARRVMNGNYFFNNVDGRDFVDRSAEFGLQDFMVSSAFAYVDFDNDGDLDIITNAINGPLKVYVNGEVRNRSVSIELQDLRANRFGIGSKIYGYYGVDGERSQMREIKAGGGFLSMDPPVAHFGLGDHEALTRLEIVWSTGERTRLDGPFPAGARYRIERLPAAPAQATASPAAAPS